MREIGGGSRPVLQVAGAGAAVGEDYLLCASGLRWVARANSHAAACGPPLVVGLYSRVEAKLGARWIGRLSGRRMLGWVGRPSGKDVAGGGAARAEDRKSVV